MPLLNLVLEHVRKQDEEFKRHCEESNRKFNETVAHNRAVMEEAKAKSTERRRAWRDEQDEKQVRQSPWFSALKRGHFE